MSDGLRWLTAAFIAWLAVAAPAGAQPECDVNELLAGARTALEDAEFERADVLLDGVSRCPLDLDDLRAMLELQVLVSFADERLGALERSLRALASLDPEAAAPAFFPGAVVARWEEIRAQSEPLDAEVELVSEYQDGIHRVGLVANRRQDPGNLVLRVDVFARLSGSGDYRLMRPGQRLEIDEPHEPATIEAHLALFGPGEARLASRGTPSDPVRLEVDPVPVDRRPLRIGLVVGGLLLAVGAAVFVVAAVRTDGFRSDETTANPATRALMSF